MYKIRIGKILGAAALASACLLTFGAAAFAQGTAEEAEVSAIAVEEPGVLIVSVQNGSPAATAGLQRGDIVLEVDGAPVNNGAALQAALLALKPGDEVTLTIQHGDEQKEVTLTLGDRNGQPFLGIVPHWPEGPAMRMRRGPWAAPGAAVGIAPFWRMAGDPSGMLHLTSTVGVYVVEVVEDSPAAAAGLERGDQIIAVDGDPVASGDALAAIIKTHEPGDEITLEVQSKGDASQTREVAVTLGESPDGAAFLGVRLAPAIFLADEISAQPGPSVGLRRFFFGPRQDFQLRQAPFMAAPAMPPVMVAPYGYGAPGFFPFASTPGGVLIWVAPAQPGWMGAPMFQFHGVPFGYSGEIQTDQRDESGPPDVMFEAVPGQGPVHFEIAVDEAI